MWDWAKAEFEQATQRSVDRRLLEDESAAWQTDPWNSYRPGLDEDRDRPEDDDGLAGVGAR